MSHECKEIDQKKSVLKAGMVSKRLRRKGKTKNKRRARMCAGSLTRRNRSSALQCSRVFQAKADKLPYSKTRYSLCKWTRPGLYRRTGKRHLDWVRPGQGNRARLLEEKEEYIRRRGDHNRDKTMKYLYEKEKETNNEIRDVKDMQKTELRNLDPTQIDFGSPKSAAAANRYWSGLKELVEEERQLKERKQVLDHYAREYERLYTDGWKGAVTSSLQTGVERLFEARRNLEANFKE